MTCPPFTRPGDSGTLWFYDPPQRGHRDDPPTVSLAQCRRIADAARGAAADRHAVGWAALCPTDGGAQRVCARLASCRRSCRELRVEIVRNWSTGHDEYWGKIGHFTIGWKACDRTRRRIPRRVMMANQARIGFGDDDWSEGRNVQDGARWFVPLADVPDYVWVSGRAHEPIQHFADIDIHDIDGGPCCSTRRERPDNWPRPSGRPTSTASPRPVLGRTRACCRFASGRSGTPWSSTARRETSMHFVAAAGVLAHYVGDASQPLHCSYMHHGIPPMHKHQGRRYPAQKESAEFTAFKKTSKAKIHAIYEEGMLEIDAGAALAGVDAALQQAQLNPGAITSGHDAAVATVRLMHASQQRLPPRAIINADDPSLGPKARAAALWKRKRSENRRSSPSPTASHC